MKHWYKCLALGLVFGLATTILVACGPKLDATSRNEANGSQMVNRQTDDDKNKDDKTDTTEQQNIAQDDNTTQTDNEVGNEQQTENQDTSEQNDEENTTPISEPCQHNFIDWRIDQDATCSTEGIEESFCTICGERTTRTIPTNDNHNYEVTVIEPSCTEAGYTLHTCRDCGHEYADEVPTTDHTFDEATHRCTGCGLFQDPIKNLEGSKWYLKAEAENDWSLSKKDWAIILNNGTYTCYKGSLLEDGTFAVNPNNKPIERYAGTYQISIINGIHYLKLITNQELDGPVLFELTYQVVKDPISQKVYYTFNKTGFIFVDNGYQNSTLVFGGYGL